MSTAPFQPIPETTQAHVDRLVGSQVGELDVGERVAEGRFGTLYRARRRASGKDVMLEVLRTGVISNDHEMRAVNAIKCAGIAEVRASDTSVGVRRAWLFRALSSGAGACRSETCSVVVSVVMRLVIHRERKPSRVVATDVPERPRTWKGPLTEG